MKLSGSARLLTATILLCLAAGPAHSLPDDVTLEEFTPTGSFALPLALRHAGDGSDRMFVVEQEGAIHVIEDGDILQTPFLDISAMTGGSLFSEQGLLGLAFHPDYPSNGLFYVNFTASGVTGVTNGDTVIAEFQVSADDANVADPDSMRIVMTIVQDAGNHNGGDLDFGPDGYLYIGMGDGGGGGDPCNRAQTLDPDDLDTGFGCEDHPSTALLGKMLRIDVDNTTPAGSNNLCAADGDGSAGYAVPSGNPFAGDDNACGEVWTLGLRNPWRWSFDRDTNDIWIADVGQNAWEEVNLEPAASGGDINYGWNCYEGTGQYGPADCTLPDHTPPIMEYPISGQPECAVTGGYRYRGPVTSLQGTYLFADFCSRRLYVANEDNGDWDFVEDQIIGAGSGYADGVSGFGEDETGNVYAIQRNGRIWRFEGDTQDPAPELASLTPDSGPESGGTEVTITGDNFIDGAQVTFNGAACAGTSVDSSTTITCTTPAGDAGPVDVTVTNPDDQSDTLTDGFTYEAEPDPAPELASLTPNSGPESGGTAVTLEGANFADGAQVHFNGTECPVVDTQGDTAITCTTPPGESGPADVTVTNPDGQFDTLADGFLYLPDLIFEDRFEELEEALRQLDL